MQLQLPDQGVPDRVSIQQKAAPGVFPVATLDGPGCIKRLWIVPVRRTPNWENRRMYLRIYFDGEASPSVSAPVGDFFGVMHGQPYYPINTPLLSVQAESGYTAYFEMPFAASARIELELDTDAFLALTIDWHRYPGQEMRETRRFHAQWRRENPTQSYGREYTILDATGKGSLLGFAYGVRLVDNEDRWSHGGADNLYIDGEGEHPAYLRGIGGEDTFGVGFGGALHPPETHLLQGMPYYVHEDTGEARPAQRVTGYRFFTADTIPFQTSLHMRFGCMVNDICSTAYWYQEEPHTPFAVLPPFDRLLPGTALPCEATMLPAAQSGAWRLYGPFFNRDDRAMRALLAPELGHALPGSMDGLHDPDSLWRTDASIRAGKDVPRCVDYDATHGFVDFRHAFRPHTRGVSPTEVGAAVARGVLHVQRDMTVRLRIAYDDAMSLRVDGEMHEMPPHSFFRTEELSLVLKAGTHALSIKLSNTRGNNCGGWCFAFQAHGMDGLRLLPERETMQGR